MAVDMFMKIDDIKGESIDSKHKDENEVLSWSRSKPPPGTSHSGAGGGAGKVKVEDLSFTKHTDLSTPNLKKLCCSGKHFQKATLTVRKAGGEALDYIKLELSDGLISSVSTGATKGDDRLTETITLNFAAFKYEYTPQDAKGVGGGAVPAQWNIAKNAEK
jgi:type VI secretion system secreted protein Hcp